MANETINVETSISVSDFGEEFRKGLEDYNKNRKDSEPSIDPETVKLVQSHGFTGAEIAIFFGNAILGGITYDVCKYVVLSYVLPRIQARFGADAAKIKEPD